MGVPVFAVIYDLARRHLVARLKARGKLHVLAGGSDNAGDAAGGDAAGQDSNDT